MEEIVLGIYEHFKGDRYRVILTGRHSETKEEQVVYFSLDHPETGFWIRPKGMFLENIILDGREVPRFKRVE